MLKRGTDLVGELVAVDGRSTSTCAGGITALNHEGWNNAVEYDVVVVAASSESREVAAGFGGVVVVEFDCDGALRSVSDSCLVRNIVTTYHSRLEYYVCRHH